ncbi:MAG: GrpB family protein [Puniceicoccales bacterium]|jgi:GrpB-like predicted nucleotidyltransferase (UPF0157 family)|nr:GrpB family protein [Puniceicoccales bacterium]
MVALSNTNKGYAGGKSGVNTKKEQLNFIEVVPYDPSWPAMFEAEKEIIWAALGGSCVAVHHIGSTSVPGLAAKPKIDIVAVAKDRKSAVTNLEKAGYFYEGEWNVPLKCGFTKRGDINVNLHVFFEENHPEIELNLQFRDYLRNHRDVCNEYAALKMKILQDKAAHQRIGKLSFPVYTLRKRNFIDKIIKNIGYNRLRVLKCIAEDEWEAVKIFRRNYFDRFGVSDPINGNLDGPNHEHFLLYRGVEIIGYAHIHVSSKSKAELSILETPTQKDFSWFLDMIKKWMEAHGYEFLSALRNSKFEI